MTRRPFGHVRHLPSGNWQARWMGPDGVHHKAPRTFATQKEGEAWLHGVKADLDGADSAGVHELEHLLIVQAGWLSRTRLIVHLSSRHGMQVQHVTDEPGLNSLQERHAAAHNNGNGR